MGCAQSSNIVITIRTELVDTQPESVKYQLKLSIKRDDPILFQQIMEAHNVSLQEKINDEFDKNWTFFHFAASKNAVKVIESFLTRSLGESQLSFDIVNARDMLGDTPIQTAYNSSCFEAFEAIIICCAKYQHKVNFRPDFVRFLDDDSPYKTTIDAYKQKTLKTERESGGKIDSSKDEERYLTIINRGELESAYKAARSSLKIDKKFADKDFWNNNTSLGDKVSWLSLETLLKDPYVICGKGALDLTLNSSSINPNLGAVFCALSEYPHILHRILHSLEKSSEGIASLILYQDGKPNLLLLDEYFPSDKSKNKIIGQQPYHKEVWPMLIEKGLAKLTGSYQNMSKLNLVELLEAVLGAPVKKLKVDDQSIDLFWLTLQDLDHLNCLNFVENKNNQHFFIAGICSLNEKKIVKLKACSSSAKVEKSLSETEFDEESRAIVGFETQNDGYYFVDFEDFGAQFKEISVCYFNEEWNRKAILIKSLGAKAETFELEVKQETKIFLSFTQTFEASSSAYPLHFALIQKEGDEMKAIAEGDQNCKTGAKICYVKDGENLNLDPGKYYVQVKGIAKSHKASHQGVLTTYSSLPVSLTPTNNKTVLENIFISFGKANRLREPCGPGCEFTSGWWSSYHWLYFENNSTSNWEVEIKFENLVNLKVAKPFRTTGSEPFKLQVPKGQKKIVYLEKKDLTKESDLRLDMNHIFT